MKHIIKKINNKFYVFSVDQYGNTYDTMRHYDTVQRAKLFKRKLQLEDKLGFVANCDWIYKQLDIIETKLLSTNN